MISKELAQTVFDKVHEAIPYPIIICGAGGEVYAATLAQRVGKIHDVSRDILTGRLVELVITPEMQEQYVRQGKDIRNGIHIPIVVHGEKIATVGITGIPDEVRPYGNMIRLTIELVYEEILVRERIMKAHREIDAGVGELAATSQELYAGAEQVVASNDASSAIVRQVSDILGEVKSNLALIDGIARKTNLISVNAAIESARAGVYGQAFAVVAREMKNLSGDTASYSKKITDLNDHFSARFQDILKIIDGNNAAAFGQKEAIRTLTEKTERIKSALSELMH